MFDRLLTVARPAIGAARTVTRRLRGAAERSVVTPLGAVVLAASVLSLVVAVAAQWAEAALAGTVGLLTPALGVAFTVGRTTVRVEIAADRHRLRPGAQTTGHVRLTNVGGRPMLPLSLHVAVGGKDRGFRVPALSAAGTTSCDFPVGAPRRGVVAIGPVTTVRGDPLGLLARTVRWRNVVEVFVHPETTEINPIGSGLRHDLEGRTGTELSSSDLAFHTLREYVPGDDRRYIHWRSSAKVSSATPGGKLLVRQFLETRRTHLLVVVDGDPAVYPDPDGFETAISVGASVAVRAVGDRLDATILVCDHVARTATREAILDTCSRALPSGVPLAARVTAAVRVAPDATAAILVTGSTPTFADLRAAALRLPAAVPATIVQVTPDGRTGIRSSGSPTVLTLRELRDLRGALDGVVR